MPPVGLPVEPDVEGVLIAPGRGPVPVLGMLGEADGWLSGTPATCIACWLQRSNVARFSGPAAKAAPGSSRAAMAADANVILALVIIEPPW